MNIGDIVLYDRFGDKWASVAPSMLREDQGLGLVVSSIFPSENFEEFEGMGWTKVLSETGTVKEIAVCYIVEKI